MATDQSNSSISYSAQRRGHAYSTMDISYSQELATSPKEEKLTSELISRISSLNLLSKNLLLLTSSAIIKIESLCSSTLSKISSLKLSYEKALNDLSTSVFIYKPEAIKLLSSSLTLAKIPESLDLSIIEKFYSQQFIMLRERLVSKNVNIDKEILANDWGLYLEGHLDVINRIVVTDDDKFVISAGGTLGIDFSLRIWDLENGKQINKLEGHSNAITLIKLSKSNQFVVTGGLDCLVNVWNLPQKILEYSMFDHTTTITAIDISDNSEYIASGSRCGVILIWKAVDCDEKCTLSGHSDTINNLKFTKTNFLVSSGNQSLRVWNAINKQLEFAIKDIKTKMNAMVITGNNEFIATGNENKTIILYSFLTKKCECVLKGHRKRVACLENAHDGSFIASAGDNTVRIWSPYKKSCDAIFEGHSDLVTSIAITSDNLFIVSAGNDKIIKLWDVKLKVLVFAFSGHADFIRSLAITKNCKYLISGSLDKSIRKWNLYNKSEPFVVFQGHNDTVEAFAINNDQTCLVSGGKDFLIKVWDLKSNLEICTLKGHKKPVLALAFSNDEDFLYSASKDNIVYVWDLKSKMKSSEFSTSKSAKDWILNYEKCNNFYS